ncbi:MAG: hypothetical protein ABEI98_01190 [Halorhabdus sp.]
MTGSGTDNNRTAEGIGNRVAWLVVGTLTVALVAIPVTVAFLPVGRGAIEAIGLPFRDAYLVLPLVPAVGLGLLGVWTALRER